MHDHDHTHEHEHSHDELHSQFQNHDHGHTHAPDHVHAHVHEHDHAHTHEHTHADGSAHTHDHTHAHEHDHEHEAAHSHDGLLKNKAEAAAFLQYTLNHNAHHEEELNSLVHSLQHLALSREADEIASCIGALTSVNIRLETVLSRLK